MISLLVPYRPDASGYRAVNWAWLREYWERELPDAEIVVADDGSTPFNKCASINLAASKASGDVFIQMDADFLCAAELLLKAVSLVEGQRRWALPASKIYRLTPEATERLRIAPSSLSASIKAEHYYDQWEELSATAIYSAHAIKEIGGMPESLSGWGGEDVAWKSVLSTLWGPLKQLEGSMFHLWHPVLGATGWSEEPQLPARHPGQSMMHVMEMDIRSKQFIAAEGNPDKMRALLTDNKCLAL